MVSSACEDGKSKNASSNGGNIAHHHRHAMVPCFPLYRRRASKTVKSEDEEEEEEEEERGDERGDERGEDGEEVPRSDFDDQEEEEEEKEEVGVRTRAQQLLKEQRLAAKKKKEQEDVLFATRRLGVAKLLKEKPLSEAQPYRCGKTFLDTRNYEVTMVEQSTHGEKLYKVFESSLKRASDKSFSLLFHGTGCEATKDIMRNGMNPKLRVSSSGDWFTKDVNYALTRAICRVSATEDASSASANSTRNDISPHVHVLAFAVIDERCVKIGDHIVCDSEKHSLPVFKLSFPRNVLPPSKDDGKVKQPNDTLASPASILASMGLKRLHPSTPKK